MALPRRKLSDLTGDDENLLLNALTTFQASLNEDDEDLPPELLPALEKFRTKLGRVSNRSFSEADSVTLATLGVRTPPLLFLEEKRAEAETLGRTEIPENAMSLDVTKELIQLARRHVSMTTDAGCRILIDIILLRLASVMRDSSTEVEIIPEFPVSETILSSQAGEHSFSGTLNYLLAKIPVEHAEYFVGQPVFAVGAGVSSDASSSLTPCIIQAKKDNITAAISRATVTVASFCKQHSIPVLRGCITTGEQWFFFVYRSGESGGEVCLGDVRFDLCKDLEGLPLILGLLMDMINNATILEQQYYRYWQAATHGKDQ